MPLSVSIWSAGPLAVGHSAIARLRPFTGCLQPGQTSSVYADALSRLSDRLHYLNTSGDKSQDATRFWFDTRANLRREMEGEETFEPGTKHPELTMLRLLMVLTPTNETETTNRLKIKDQIWWAPVFVSQQQLLDCRRRMQRPPARQLHANQTLTRASGPLGGAHGPGLCCREVT